MCSSPHSSHHQFADHGLLRVLGSDTAQLGVRTATSSHLSSPPHSSHPQVADHGLLTVLGSDTAQLGVSAVKKAAGGALFVHSAEVMSGAIKKGAQVRGLVGEGERSGQRGAA